MMVDNLTSAERYLRTPEAARLLGLSGRTLEKHRTHGTGPRYRKLGGRVVYRLSDIEAFESARVHNNTIGPVDQDIEAEPADGNR